MNTEMSETYRQIAAAPAVDVGKIIGDVGRFDEAKLVAIPITTEVPSAITAEKLIRVGCQYKSSDPRMVAELANLLTNFKFRAYEHGLQWDIHEAIVFHSKDDSEIRVILGGGRGYFLGQIVDSKHQSQVLVAGDFDALEHVYDWAKRADYVPIQDAYTDRGCRKEVQQGFKKALDPLASSHQLGDSA